MLPMQSITKAERGKGKNPEKEDICLKKDNQEGGGGGMSLGFDRPTEGYSASIIVEKKKSVVETSQPITYSLVQLAATACSIGATCSESVFRRFGSDS